MLLNPQKSFTVVRQIANHIDTGTYYVRAVIRYAYTDVLITNLDLDLKGDQRYSKNWQVVADPSGQGTYISIVTSVYTDAGHTTKSENYGDEENTYRVFDDMSPAMKGGGGLDMRTTRRIMEESLEKMKFPEQEKISIPKQKEYDDKFNELTRGLSDIKTLVASLPAENVNLSPVVSRLNELSQELKTKPVMKEILSLMEVGLLKVVKKEIPKIMEKAEFTIPFKNLTMTPKKEEKQPFNIKSLAK